MQGPPFPLNVFQVIFYSPYLFTHNAPEQLYLFLCLNLPNFYMFMILVVRIVDDSSCSNLQLGGLFICYFKIVMTQFLEVKANL